MYWAMLTLTGLMSVALIFQLLGWMWRLYPGVTLLIIAAIFATTAIYLRKKHDFQP